MESSKKVVIVLLVMCSCLLPATVNAQTWFNEWFRQKKTQTRYSKRQIVHLKIYVELLKEGYKVVRRGLTTIEHIKNDEVNLHRDFFGSLNKVNPRINNLAKVADIIAFQVFIINDLKAVSNFCRRRSQFTAEEVRYVAEVYSNILVLSDANLSELLMIIRSDNTVMTDDERLKRIDLLYEDVLDKHAFVQAFGGEVRLIAAQREVEEKNLEVLKQTYGL